MYENNKEDILRGRIDYTMVSLISPKINVLIVGGGRAALTKARTFVKKGCRVWVISKEFTQEFNELSGYPNLKCIKGEYSKQYISDKHIVIIATNCEETNQNIRNHCEEFYKLYIDCSTPKKGLCITTCQRSTKNITFGININDFSPKTSVFLADKIKNQLEKYDDFVTFTAFIRNSIKDFENKNEIMNFICSEDFLFFYNKGMAKSVFQMFYPNTQLFKD